MVEQVWKNIDNKTFFVYLDIIDEHVRSGYHKLNP